MYNTRRQKYNINCRRIYFLQLVGVAVRSNCVQCYYDNDNLSSVSALQLFVDSGAVSSYWKLEKLKSRAYSRLTRLFWVGGTKGNAVGSRHAAGIRVAWKLIAVAERPAWAARLKRPTKTAEAKRFEQGLAWVDSGCRRAFQIGGRWDSRKWDFSMGWGETAAIRHNYDSKFQFRTHKCVHSSVHKRCLKPPVTGRPLSYRRSGLNGCRRRGLAVWAKLSKTPWSICVSCPSHNMFSLLLTVVVRW